MTIRIAGLELEVFPDVYEPAEDSVMLARHVSRLRGKILDIGCGSGIQSLVAGAAEPENRVLGVDINPSAVRCAKANAGINGILNATFLESDLFSKVRGRFDSIVFNPPYLPTSDDEKVRGNLNLALDGGKDGRAVTDRFLADFPRYLEDDGMVLMVESSLAGIEKTCSRLRELGFEPNIVDEERFFFERIVVIGAKRVAAPEGVRKTRSKKRRPKK